MKEALGISRQILVMGLKPNFLGVGHVRNIVGTASVVGMIYLTTEPENLYAKYGFTKTASKTLSTDLVV
jgi:hypothetical protein